MPGALGQVMLIPYVEGIMAVIQEVTKRPVMGPKYKDSVYDPQLAGSNGRTVRKILDYLEPGVTDSVLSFWVREIRKKYAGKPMRFLDLFPGYGMEFDEESGRPIKAVTHQILSSTPNRHIYCPSRPAE